MVGVALVARRANAGGTMGAHFADSIDAALVVEHAGVLALLTDAGQRVGTVRIDGAFRLAFHVGIALEAEGTAALAGAARGTRHSVPPAGIRIAGVHNVRLDGRRTDALHQGVPDEAGQAGAQRRVDADIALRVAAAHAGARVVAVVVAAGAVRRTVRVDDALRLAFHVGVALVLGRAGAHTVIAFAAWSGSTATRIGVAGVRHHRLR